VICGLMMLNGARAQHDSINYTDAKGLKQGKWVTTNKIHHKKYKEICYYKDNLRDSIRYYYYPNGNLVCRNYFKKGLRDGVCHQFMEDGTIDGIYIYKDDNLIWFMWFKEKGCPYFEQSAGDNRGILYENGKWCDTLHPPDTIAPNFTDAKGLKQGKWVEKDTVDGKIFKEIGYYKDGLEDSIENYYYPNGELNERTYFKKGVEDGVCHIFRKDGTISILLIYKDDNLIWEMKFNNEGCPLEEQSNGIGRVILYENGKWKK